MLRGSKIVIKFEFVFDVEYLVLYNIIEILKFIVNINYYYKKNKWKLLK